MRHSIQNKAFYIFDMAKNIYIKTRHKPLSRFDPVTESQDSKEHTKHKQKKTLMSAFDLLCFLLITPLLIMALVQEFDTICASERRTTYLKRSKRDMRTCRVLTPRRRYMLYLILLFLLTLATVDVLIFNPCYLFWLVNCS